MHTVHTLFCLYAILLQRSIFTQDTVLQGGMCTMADQLTHKVCTVIKYNDLCNSAGQLLVTQVPNLDPTPVLHFCLS